MAVRVFRYGQDEFARRGEEIYDRRIKPNLRAEDDNKYVAIDIETADFEVDANDYAATERLMTRHPQAQIWLARVGHSTARRFGGGTVRGAQE